MVDRTNPNSLLDYRLIAHTFGYRIFIHDLNTRFSFQAAKLLYLTSQGYKKYSNIFSSESIINIVPSH